MKQPINKNLLYAGVTGTLLSLIEECESKSIIKAIIFTLEN